jgi:hypothetical protein
MQVDLLRLFWSLWNEDGKWVTYTLTPMSPLLQNASISHSCWLDMVAPKLKRMDIIPEHGIVRALLQSLRQFVRQSHHPELDQSKLILLSFSGGGSASIRSLLPIS